MPVPRRGISRSLRAPPILWQAEKAQADSGVSSRKGEYSCPQAVCPWGGFSSEVLLDASIFVGKWMHHKPAALAADRYFQLRKPRQ